MVGSDRQLYSAGQNSPGSNRWGAYINQSSGWVEGSWLSLKNESTSYQSGDPAKDHNPAIAQDADGRLAVFLVLNGHLNHLVQRTKPSAGKWAGAWYRLME